MAVPYSFATQTGSIPLSQLDSNFATAITLGNTAVVLGNTYSTIGNLTLSNVTISSGNVSINVSNVSTLNVVTLTVTGNETVGGNVTITGNVSVNVANVTTLNATSSTITGNETVGGNVTVTGNVSVNNATFSNSLTLSGGTANGVAYLNGSKVLTTGSALTFDGTNFGVPTGNLRIGTSASSGPYQIFYNASNDAYGTLQMTSTGFQMSADFSATGGYKPLLFYTNGSEQMRLTSTGLGIGTSSPAYKLDVQTSSGNAVVNVYQTASSGSSIASSILRTAGTGPSWWQIDTGNTASGLNGAIRWFDNFAAAERMRIDSSGNVGIGTSSPNASAILDAQSTTKGVRMPNMTTTQKNAISSPAAGLMVFDTTLAKLCVYTGAAWQTITSI
jgi:hypothetical protein